ncbi:MAG: beta-ketoacyl-[acyl-carrier-protein] synthase family protein [Puniceicoccales bacterium]|jgi:3-oxoacyl-[acyl-carrier-protein] synthase-1|nr:beta-ketoacyl-[acyl-carrier-protein] synthase family protein [Puniceicoccales bacterium]
MRNVVVTGLGFICSIGNDRAAVLDSLKNLKHGIAPCPAFNDPKNPIRLTGAIRGFDTSSKDPEDWSWPTAYTVKRDILRGFAPHGLFAYCSLLQAIADARLTPSEVSNERTGMFTASAGSAGMLHHHLTRMFESGVMRCSPMGVVNSVVGTLSFNLVAAFRILGASCGFASACASSGHALGYAHDEIALGRQDRVIVIGGEDGNLETILPFAGMRALSTVSDPRLASCPFDEKRSGFVGTGGATTMILEEESIARQRGAPIHARFTAWGQASDGYSPAISHPEGLGLAASMTNCLAAADILPAEVDYINAHATSTPIGDRSEILAIKQVFKDGKTPAISSTKGLTGHGLSMSSILEAAFCCMAIDGQFIPGNAHLVTPLTEAAGLHLPTATTSAAIKFALSNSSGFGGANVSLLFARA